MTKGKDEHAANYKDFSWLNFFKPDGETVAFLKKKYPFLHQLDLETCLTAKTQRPKIEFNQKYAFFVLHFPYFDKKAGKIKVAELDVFLGKRFLVTLYHENFSFIGSTFSSAIKDEKRRERLMAAGPELLLYRLLRRNINRFSSLLDRLGLEIDEADQKMFVQEARSLVEKIFRLRRDIVILKTSITPQINIFSQMEAKSSTDPKDRLGEYWGALTDNLGRLADRLENYHELIIGLSSTMESYLTYKTNEIIKVLTIFSVILLPLTFITGAYGMNLASLPLAQNPLSFWLISLGMIALAAAMILFFKKKRWL